MTKRSFLGVIAVVTAVALTGSALIASNMGFKMNYRLKSAQDAPTGANADGSNLFALPDFRPTGINTAKNLMDDIGSVSTLAVSKFITSSAAFQSYTGRKGSAPDFALEKGIAYYVKIAPNSGVDYIVAGADDPAYAYLLKISTDPPTGPNADGSNFYAWNYHQTAQTAKALMDDVGSANVLAVSKYIKQTSAFQSYTGRKGSAADYSLTPGEGYIVKMNPATPSVNYLPSHY